MHNDLKSTTQIVPWLILGARNIEVFSWVCVQIIEHFELSDSFRPFSQGYLVRRTVIQLLNRPSNSPLLTF